MFAPSNSEFRVHLFGEFRLERSGAAVHLSRRKVKSLLAFLILHPEPHPREKLATLLWSEATDSDARSSLRNALAVLRTTLGDGSLTERQGSVQLNPALPLWVDVRDLQRAAAPTAPIPEAQTAIALYRGDLLAEFYDEWVLARRRQVFTLYVQMLLRLVQHKRSNSEYAEAIELAKSVLAADAANEAAFQHLMFCHMALGERIAALADYAECVHTLRTELDAEPLPETTALYNWIRQTGEADAFSPARITNLPIPLTSFIGRRQERNDLKQHLQTARLVSLIGTGGAGKTRLAIQLGTELLGSFSDGVWWVELASVVNAEGVLPAIAKALGRRESAQQTLQEALVEYVRPRAMLLVLDNCEHLLDACVSIVAALLDAAPALKILTTTREPLEMLGERLHPLAALAVPQANTLDQLLLEYDSVHLFVERATAVNPEFALNASNAAAVVQICQRLDGIPLALELAAARVREFGPQEIAVGLDDRFNLLTRGNRAALPRQQTLRALIAWSYDLLDETERALFTQLGVFTGNFDVTAAAEICSTTANVPVVLARLVGKSLLNVTPVGARQLYRQLDTIQHYAHEQLVAQDLAHTLHTRHLDYIVGIAIEAEGEIRGERQVEWVARLDAERDNWLAALAWARTERCAEKMARLAIALRFYWLMHGNRNEGRYWLEQVIALQAADEPDDALRARTLDALGLLMLGHGDYAEAEEKLLMALELAGRAENDNLRATILTRLGLVTFHSGQLERAAAFYQASLPLSRRANDKIVEAVAVSNLADIAKARGELDEATEYLDASVVLFREGGDRWNLANVLNSLGEVALLRHKLGRAQSLARQSLSIYQELGSNAGMGMARLSLSSVALERNDFQNAEAELRQALALWQTVDDGKGILLVLEGIARLELARGNAARSLCLLAAIRAGYRVLGVQLYTPEESRLENLIVSARASLPELQAKAAWEQGMRMTRAEATAFAQEA